MPEHLPPVTVATPAPVSVVTPVVRKSLWGRVFDGVSLAGALALAVMEGLGPIDWTALGLTPQRATLAAILWTAVRLALTFRPVRLEDVRVEPEAPR